MKRSKTMDALIKRNNRVVKTMASEIKYLCDEAVDHQYGFKQFRELLLNRIDTTYFCGHLDKLDR